MKNFIIILRNNEKSEKFGNIAIESGKDLGWDITRFDAIDGRTLSLDDLLNKYRLFVNTQNKKCRRLMDRPGVRGCFLSHYLLWQKCVYLNETIGIFEDDVLFVKSYSIIDNNFQDILKLEKLKQGKIYAAGEWWEGAHSYLLTPQGAEKLINWSHNNGILPADMMLGTNILKIDFNSDKTVILNPDSQINLEQQSLTRNL